MVLATLPYGDDEEEERQAFMQENTANWPELQTFACDVADDTFVEYFMQEVVRYDLKLPEPTDKRISSRKKNKVKRYIPY